MNWNGNGNCDFRENGPFAPHSQSILSVFIKSLKMLHVLKVENFGLTFLLKITKNFKNKSLKTFKIQFFIIKAFASDF